MVDIPLKYPTTEEKITGINKDSGTYTPPEEYNVKQSNGESNGDNRTDNSRTDEGNA